MSKLNVEGYELRKELYYDTASDMWVKVDGNKARLGIDPLGLEINGTLSQLALAGTGTKVKRGEQLGSLEAEKFVGPILSPLSSEVVAINDEILNNISTIHRTPYESWIVEVEMDYPAELELLVSGDDLQPAFELRLAEYRKKGLLAR